MRKGGFTQNNLALGTQRHRWLLIGLANHHLYPAKGGKFRLRAGRIHLNLALNFE
jgi:hypothetical protein